MATREHDTAEDLLAFIHASPTPRHCVAEAARRMQGAGFAELREREPWRLQEAGAYFVRRGGSIAAFRLGTSPLAEAGVRMLGAHTDSPNLRVKPFADVRRHGYHQLGVETYGGLLDYTWLDRDLGLAGVIVVRTPDGSGLEERLLRIDQPILRVPSLAIHLNREIREKGLKLNPQANLPPILALASGDAPVAASELSAIVADWILVDQRRILSWELSLFDVQPPARGGLRNEFVFAARLDNQAMCHASLTALLRCAASDATQLVALYDHEEVGSESTDGAGGDLVERILRRLADHEGPGAVPGGLARASARSFQVSADMAHAVHPNFADRHEPEHQPRLNAGPVIKINRSQRYATSARTEAHFEALCQDAEVAYQKFVSRTDLACGTTIGPISAARLGIETVDVGNPMLAMHSIREMGGARDPEAMTCVLERCLTSPLRLS